MLDEKRMKGGRMEDVDVNGRNSVHILQGQNHMLGKAWFKIQPNRVGPGKLVGVLRSNFVY